LSVLFLPEVQQIIITAIKDVKSQFNLLQKKWSSREEKVFKMRVKERWRRDLWRIRVRTRRTKRLGYHRLSVISSALLMNFRAS